MKGFEMKKALIIFALLSSGAHAADIKSLSDDDLLKAAKICYDLQLKNIANPSPEVSYQCRPILGEQNARAQAKAKAENKSKLDDLNAILKK